MTRHDRPEGRPAGVGTPSNRTPSLRQNQAITGTVLRLGGVDPEEIAAELIEKTGPVVAAAIAAELVALLVGVAK